MTEAHNKTWDAIPSLDLEMDSDYEKRLKSKEGRKADRASFSTLKHLLDKKHSAIPIRIGTAKKGTFDGFIIDISSTGLRVQIPKPLAENERVKVGFIVNTRTIMANAVARWTQTGKDRYITGLEFHGIVPSDKEFLKSLSSASLLMKIGSVKER